MKYLLYVLLLIFSFPLQAFSQFMLEDSLIAYYRLNGNANDASGNGHHGILYGPSDTTDRFSNPDNAYYFDEFDLFDYIEVASTPALNPGAEFSISAWVKYFGSGSLDCIIAKGESGEVGFYSLRIFDSAFRRVEFLITFADSTTTRIFTGDLSFLLFNGTNVVATYDGTSMKIFVGGMLRAVQALSKSLGSNMIPVTIGKRTAALPYYFNGILDDIRLYSRALNSCDIDELFRDSLFSSTGVSENAVCAGDSADILIYSSIAAKKYQLLTKPARDRIATPVHGNGGLRMLSTGPITEDQSFWIMELDTATGCERAIGLYTINLYVVGTPTIFQVGGDSLKSSVMGDSYRWFLDGSTLPETTRTILASSGAYRVMVIENNCLSDTSDVFVFTGLHRSPESKGQSLTIFPNPNSGSFVVKMDNPIHITLTIEISDLFGRVLYNKKIHSEEVEIKNFTSGIYIVRLKTRQAVFYKTIVVE